MKEGTLYKVTNRDQWIVLERWKENDTYYQRAYQLHPDSVSSSNVSGSKVKFEVVDGYAKIIR